MTYNPNIPQATDLISNSQAQILENFSQLNTQFGIDHAALTTGDGVHKKVSLINQGSDPAIPGAANSVLYTKTANGGPQLYFENGTASPSVVQLTVQKTSVPSVAAAPDQGVSFLPGGQLIQWGKSTTNATVFPVAFNAAPTINPVITVTMLSAANQTFGGVVSAASNTGFTVQNNAGTLNFSYFWIAIGQA